MYNQGCVVVCVSFCVKLRCFAGLALPTPPVLHSRLTNVLTQNTKNAAVLSAASPLVTASTTPSNRSSGIGTPKHLRFSVPHQAAADNEEDVDDDDDDEDDVDFDLNGDVDNEEPLPTRAFDDDDDDDVDVMMTDKESTPPVPDDDDGWRATPEREETPSPPAASAQAAAATARDGSRQDVSAMDEDSFHSTDSSPLARRSIKDKSPNTSLRSVRSLPVPALSVTISFVLNVHQ